MTQREQRILILVGVVVFGGLVFNLWPRGTDSTEMNGTNGSQLQEANHLLHTRLNIMAREKAVTTKLNILLKRFYSTNTLETPSVNLLKEVESIAAQSNLDVHQKNMVSFHDNTIGVALEGKTTPESLVRFLQRTTQDRIGLRIQRLQIHSLPDTKQLNYQVTLITLLVK